MNAAEVRLALARVAGYLALLRAIEGRKVGQPVTGP